jgi:hypothetical protein
MLVAPLGLYFGLRGGSGKPAAGTSATATPSAAAPSLAPSGSAGDFYVNLLAMTKQDTGLGGANPFNAAAHVTVRATD